MLLQGAGGTSLLATLVSVGFIEGLTRWLTGKESTGQCRHGFEYSSLYYIVGPCYLSLGREDSLEEEMATHSPILSWRIPRTEEPGSLQSLGPQESRRLSDETTTTTTTHTLAWKIPWTEEPPGYTVYGGHKELDTTEHVRRQGPMNLLA